MSQINSQRPGPAPLHNNSDSNVGQTSSTDNPANIPRNPPQPTQNAQSPLDWANFMNFQTPPVVNPAHSANAYNNHRMPSQDDQYSNFAHGISMSRPSPSSINFQQPLPRGSTSSSGSSRHNPNRQYSQSSASSQPQLPTYHVPSQTPPQGPSPRSPVEQPMIGKGKSPATKSSETQDNGLSLDPSAFSRDIRFQVPSFLTNQVGGAPTFPPGGEAWSGFSGANLFGPDIGQLTPGTIFSNAFGITNSASDQQPYCDNNGIMQNMGGFVNENAGWEQWNQDQNKNEANNQMNANNSNNNNLGAMFYVNPNPSPSILASRNPSNREPSHRTPRNQMVSSINTNLHSSSAMDNQGPHQSPRTSYPSNPSSSGSMPTSAILPQQPAFPQNAFGTFDNVPSASAPHNSASTINIASSSTAPYAPPSNTQSLLAGPMPPQLADGPGLYSTTGFDMVGVLARVAARRDPSTVLGPVDLSCSFLVVDIRRYDSPIVYASPSFSQLTGYELPQILGRNCRFLQSPDGEVVKGSKRKYTDNTAVAHLKRMLNAGKECQASLINYRRGGVPFINLVTVVPIPWDGTDIVYHVGFQVDLVEQPNAILRNMRDGSYQVNYTVSNPPEKPLRPPVREIGLTGLSGEVMEIMGQRVNTLSSGSGEEAGRMEWLKMVLDNTDDFVHALSLKGFFQYVSPSVRRVLEYEPEELLNKNISEFAHPSDIVPLMRELKDSTHAPTDGSSARHVNLVFRIRRKTSGYIWIESVGRLVVEAGKGRKAVILSGRARAVPALPWDSISKYGGLAETEFWGKISFQGLVLHATQGVEGVLGQPPEDVVGLSFFSLLPGGDNGPPSAMLLQSDPSAPVSSLSAAIRRVLNGETRNGAVSIQHKLVHKSGTQVDVLTVIYAPRRSIPDVPVGRGDDETSSNGESEVSRMSSHDMASITGIPPTSLVIQVKLIVSPLPGATIQTITRARPVVHAPISNLFEELETTRGTSWQYELHQLRLLNRRLKEDIAAAKARGAGKGKNKKRKFEPSAGDMGPPALPYTNLHEQQYTAAPRHQLAPGFGLVTPGMGNNSFY
ncbi:hypothetical protein I302_106113 [Kwoniella bestiolae CBS 10118]|uniref:PAS domain-containing protein n=1 Tax=Kwoniella bestiolae CBS 10118 TaxID=1296100 RepID=A0A1B9G315_9TREE|nr:hypothetical protein I302_05237 [Kwoniella bestiolae CBS 10118]OCF25417.1 hypothetical protein I302_05237 [Kwoniella bestiolae CBS 10118]